jgi:hypothetical protein
MTDDEDNIVGILALVISVGVSIFGVVNHKRVKSNCCGKKGEVSLDVDTTTPPKISSILPATQSK